MATPQKTSPVVVWWVLWAAILAGLITIYLVLGVTPPGSTGASSAVGWVCLAPLAFSCVLRWAVMPKQSDQKQALVIFILGLATAEGAGLIGILLGGERGDAFFMLGVLAVLQWAPWFARRFHESGDRRAHGLRVP